jgi:hypothetical protein
MYQRTQCVLVASCALAGISPALYAQIANDQHVHGGAERWSAPRGFRLADFASGLYAPEGQKVLQVIGDSINATNSVQGMQVGYRDRLEVPFNGWVVHADSGNSEIGYTNAQRTHSTNAIRIPGDTFANGLSAISPVRTRDVVWSGNVANGGTLSDSFILNYRLVDMPLGNPFGPSATIDARLLMYEGAHQLAGFEATGVRGSSTVSSGFYTRPSTVANAITWIDRVISPTSGDPGIRLKSDASTAESTSGANNLIHLGTRFRAQVEDGVQIQFISHGGWTAVDHTTTSRFTDEALRQYYAATDPPTHCLLWIGQNQTVAESLNFTGSHSFAVYKADVEAIIDRHEAVIDALGAPPPVWLLVSQYKTGYDDFHHELMCEGLYNISLERPNVSFLNLYRIAEGSAFNKEVYLSDGVHPNNAGVLHLGGLINKELQDSLLCLSDYDRSGFVDVDDFTAFSTDFGNGEDTCDVDQSGFVDTDDYDLFVTHFENGC